jgi:LPS-assembly protein
MRPRAARLLLALLALLAGAAALPARAQPPATLIADAIAFDPDSGVLVAEGNVEVLYGATRLTAARVTYDGGADRVTVEGPIRIAEGDGALLEADRGELSADLRNGLLTGARMVLERQLQISAAEIGRVDGRYTQLYKSVASSCTICDDGSVPIWQIRARRAVHDAEERRLYFENAQFRVMGVPLVYLPRLRLPDPTVKRATGFLFPEIRSSDTLGTRVKVPYFITLGDHADLTVSPWLSTGPSRTLELAYRQRFVDGRINARGAITSDDLTADSMRGFAFVNGRFGLPGGYTLNFDIEQVSDPDYLLEYDYSPKSRLDSEIGLWRVEGDRLDEAGLTFYETLRASERNATQPTSLFGALHERRFTPAALGGAARLSLGLSGYYRSSDTRVDGPDPDTIVDGRDGVRLSAAADWRRNWTFAGGVVASALGALHADFYAIEQDDAFADTLAEVTPFAGMELRWPLARRGARASHLLEPVMQLVWSPESDEPRPNEDSTLVEFDETNLFALSRFAGNDAYERGLRANLGLRYTREDAAGWALGLSLGRVIRAEDLGQFTSASGLGGTRSDWVAAMSLGIGPSLSLHQRTVFDDDLDPAKAEWRLAYSGARLGLESTYLWLEEDPAEGMSSDISEFSIDADYRIRRHWRARSDWRYNAAARSATRAGLGLTYENECIEVDVSLSRRFTSTARVDPSTEFGLEIRFNGFGDWGGDAPVRQCSG